jgi:acyl dehydratase
MPLDPSFVGKTYPPTAPYEVGREKLREFAAAVGARDPVHHDVEAARTLGHPDLVAPPTFSVIIAIPLCQRILEEDLGVEYSHVVHGEQRFRYTRPMYAGDQLTCVFTVEDIVARGGLDFVTTRVDVSTGSGDPVVSVWCKLVVRGEG